MPTDPRTVSETYFRSWSDHDFDTFRSILADDVTFRGPLGTADDAESCVAGVRGMARMMTGLTVSLRAVEGPDVLTWFNLLTADAPPIPTVNWSHVEDGLITRIRVTFDPRPLFPPTG